MRLAVLAVASALLLLACGASDNLTTDEINQFEEDVFGGEEVFLQLASNLLEECATHNGVEVPAPPIVQDIDPGAGLAGREAIEQVGTGLVAIELAYQEAEPPDRGGRTPLTSAQEMVLGAGPIDTPEGLRFEGGCEEWATETAEQDPEVQERRELIDSYVEHLDAGFARESERLSQLNEMWTECMSSQGYSGLLELGDQFSLVREQIVRWNSGQISYEEALEFDIAIGLAAFDCATETEGERDAIKNQIAQTFIDALDAS